ncbi:MAG TPA: hypothetical protein VHG08_10240 [Longimicrobium sp.]|nr:hypothetical protein [Longimicrobium sp.]
MSDDNSQPPFGGADNDVVWEDRISATGKPYQVGRKTAGAGGAEEPNPASVSELAPGGQNLRVNWPVGSSGDVGWGGIQTYSLGTTSFPASIIYSYELTITTSYFAPQLYFYDQTGDYYGLDINLDGTHVVRYNSDAPTIVRVNIPQG